MKNKIHSLIFPTFQSGTVNQKGASLIGVMMVLTVVSLLGIAGIQISTMAERGARNDRDQQVAWQSAEAALVDAEFDMYSSTVSPRKATFMEARDITGFLPGCGTSGNNVGLCALVSTGKPAWLTVDFTTTGTSAPTTVFGQYTNRAFTAGGVGIQPAKSPRYVIEPIRDPGDRDLGSPTPKYIYRVTAMGFGPREDIQAVTQMIYRN